MPRVARVLAMKVCLEELGVRIGGSNPEDLTGDTTTLVESTAWVGDMWRTSASVNPSKEDCQNLTYLGASEAAVNQRKFGNGPTKH